MTPGERAQSRSEQIKGVSAVPDFHRHRCRRDTSAVAIVGAPDGRRGGANLNMADHQRPPTAPIQEQIDSRLTDRAREWDRRVQPEIDRIYQELTRETPAGKH